VRQLRNLYRLDLVRSFSGPRARFTEGRQRRAMQRMQQQGYIACLPDTGPAYQLVTFVGPQHPLRSVIASLCLGRNRFPVAELQAHIGLHPFSRRGLDILARAGLAITGLVGDLVTLREADHRAARLINASRRGVSRKGFRDRAVVEAILHVGDPSRRWLRVTDHRRISAASILVGEWDIDAEDLLDCKRYVRLVSRWTLPTIFAAPERRTA